MSKHFLYFVFTFLISCSGNKFLQSGPMTGYSTHTEGVVWVQTTQPAKVELRYKDTATGKTLRSEGFETRQEMAYACHIPLQLKPGQEYPYEVRINKHKVRLPYQPVIRAQSLWQWRTDPPAFRFVAGSCNYVNEPAVDRPGRSYGNGYGIFRSMDSLNPDFMVWMGDNTYLREVDWNSRSGMVHRYTHTRSLPEMQPLLARTQHYATWDDHDFGPDNSDRSFALRDEATAVFKQFWANPNYGAGGGISGTFEWQDVQFFLLDNRSFKMPNNLQTENKQLLGDQQVQWLIEALSVSKAPFKFVVIGGQVLNPVIADWSENYAKYPEEQQKLLEGIRKNNITGVIFLSGDRHHTELSRMDREGTYPLYELTVSPLTAGAVGDRALKEANTYRVDGTYYGLNNFAWMEVSGPRQNRVLKISIRKSDGTEVWNREIKASELK